MDANQKAADLTTEVAPQQQLATKSFAAGAIAGSVEILALHPLDVVKTRFQLQPIYLKSDPSYYKGIIDASSKMVQQEGLVAFYKGIVPPLLSIIPQKAIKFGAYTYFRNAIESTNAITNPILSSIAAGILAGPLEAVVISPFEVVKINLQSQRSTIPGQQRLYNGTLNALRTITKLRGPSALFSGLLPTVLRHSFFNVGFFGSYDGLNHHLPISQDWIRHLVAGFGAGVVATTLANPFDVIKTRMQQQTSIVLFEEAKYDYFGKTFSTLLKEEGIRGFFQGYFIRVIRLGLGGAIVFFTYEEALKYMNQYWR